MTEDEQRESLGNAINMVKLLSAELVYQKRIKMFEDLELVISAAGAFMTEKFPEPEYTGPIMPEAPF